METKAIQNLSFTDFSHWTPEAKVGGIAVAVAVILTLGVATRGSSLCGRAQPKPYYTPSKRDLRPPAENQVKLVSDLEGLASDKVEVLGPTTWSKFLGSSSSTLSFEGIPNVDLEKLKGDIAKLVPQVEGNKGVAVMVLPKGLSLRELFKLTNPLMPYGRNLQFYVFDQIERAYGDAKLNQPLVVLVSKGIVKGTLQKTEQDQNHILSQIGAKAPSLLAAFSLIAHTESNDSSLLSENTTRCDEWLDISGGGSPNGDYWSPIRVQPRQSDSPIRYLANSIYPMHAGEYPSDYIGAWGCYEY